MPRPEGNPPCDHCGEGWGAHSSGQNLCPNPAGGWFQTVFRYADPGHSPHHDDSVCQICGQRRAQHGNQAEGLFVCRPTGYSGRTFEPFRPTLVQPAHSSAVAAQPTRPPQPAPRPAPFDFHSMPHLSDLANLINKLAGELYRTTGRKQPLRAIVLERDMLLSMGIPPDTELHTATGPVKIQCDKPLNTCVRSTPNSVSEAPQPWIARATQARFVRMRWDDSE
jgi:hypothetical protein